MHDSDVRPVSRLIYCIFLTSSLLSDAFRPGFDAEAVERIFSVIYDHYLRMVTNSDLGNEGMISDTYRCTGNQILIADPCSALEH